MRAIMISVKPEWCRKILNGEKIGELRTTIPKCELPFKAYLYCTKCKDKKRYSDEVDIPLETGMYMGNGRVVAEWIVKEYDKYTDLTNTANLQRICKRCCVSDKKVWEYSKQGTKLIYDLHIDDLKIYDEPKELSEFCKAYRENQNFCKTAICGAFERCKLQKLKRPFQSWGYVEELKGE